MSRCKLDNLRWYIDSRAGENNEPGIFHSFMSSLATVLNHVDGNLDPVMLMGGSAFAFRIIINETMCLSAMSIFNWTEILPEVVEQAGHDCYYISRLWDEGSVEEERRMQAYELITSALDNGVPAAVWDIADSEWGVIIGYDDETGNYDTMTCKGEHSTLPFKKLGKNGIDILSVTIPGGPNERSREEIIVNSLKAAINHAEQEEWTDRPKYQDGLPAYDLWAQIFERWAMLTESGKNGNIGVDLPFFASYYASHYFSARCYARDYLEIIAGGNENLHKAHLAYKGVASFLKPVWKETPKTPNVEAAVLKKLAANIKNAKKAEKEAIDHIKKYLSEKDGTKRAFLSLD
jgi:hypothetical protein